MTLVANRFLCLVLFFLIACSKPLDLRVLQGKTMGTTYSVKWVASHPDQAKNLSIEVEAVLQLVNEQMSTYMTDSQISRLNQSKKGELIAIDESFALVLQNALALAHSTEGVFDPTVGPLVNLWGFGPMGAKLKPSDDEIKRVQSNVGYSLIELVQKEDAWFVRKTKEEVYLDLSASAKGFGVDQVGLLLESKNISHYLVEIGGEMRARGKKGRKPWVVGIEEPSKGSRSIHKKIPLLNQSIATSGNYRNYFQDGQDEFGHTLDPRTGYPVQHNLLSVSVLDPSCEKADALATALMAMGEDLGWQYALKHEIPAYFLIRKGSDIVPQKTEFFTQRIQK